MSRDLWESYIVWKNTPRHERGVIVTEADWAKQHGYKDVKTMRTWRVKPEFQALEQKILSRLAKKAASDFEAGDVESLAITGDVDFSEERDYLLVKTQLLQSAKSGNLKATELFMKLYGKSWIDEEQSSRSNDYSSMDLERLVAIATASLSPSAMAKALVDQGWTVCEPA